MNIRFWNKTLFNVISFVIFFTILPTLSKANFIVGPTYLLPGTEGVYTLYDTTKRADWKVTGDAIVLTSVTNTNTITIRAKDTCYGFLFLRADIAGAKQLRKTCIVEDRKQPVFDEGFDTAVLPPNNLAGHVPTATDNSGKPVTVFLKDYQYSGSGCQMNLIWEAVDACGNRANMTQVVISTERDTIAPVFAPYIERLVYDCGSVPSPFIKPVATDNSSGLVSVNIVSQLVIESPRNIFSCVDKQYTVIWEATDACGNKSRITQCILIQDKTAPKIDSAGIMYLSNCRLSDIPKYTPKAKDNCSENLYYTLQARKSTPKMCGFDVEDFWMVEDGCGNKAYTTQKIELRDSTPPKFMMLMPICAPCNMIPTMFPTPMAMDDCDPSVTVTWDNQTQFLVNTSRGCIGMPYTVVIRWKAVDDCGNVSYALQDVNIQNMCGGMMGGGGDLQRLNDISQSEQFEKNKTNDTHGVDYQLNIQNSKVKNANDLKIQTFPNPTNGTVYISLISPVSGKGNITFYDISGKEVGVLQEQNIRAFEQNTLTYQFPPSTNSGLIFYQISVEGYRQSGKIQYMKP